MAEIGKNRCDPRKERQDPGTVGIMAKNPESAGHEHRRFGIAPRFADNIFDRGLAQPGRNVNTAASRCQRQRTSGGHRRSRTINALARNAHNPGAFCPTWRPLPAVLPSTSAMSFLRLQPSRGGKEWPNRRGSWPAEFRVFAMDPDGGPGLASPRICGSQTVPIVGRSTPSTRLSHISAEASNQSGHGGCIRHGPDFALSRKTEARSAGSSSTSAPIVMRTRKKAR